MDPEIDYLNTKQVAEILFISTRHVITLIKKDEFPGTVRPGKSFMIPRKSVHDYIIRKDKGYATQ